jgi:hypothetical protein
MISYAVRSSTFDGVFRYRKRFCHLYPLSIFRLADISEKICSSERCLSPYNNVTIQRPDARFSRAFGFLRGIIPENIVDVDLMTFQARAEFNPIRPPMTRSKKSDN